MLPGHQGLMASRLPQTQQRLKSGEHPLALLKHALNLLADVTAQGVVQGALLVIEVASGLLSEHAQVGEHHPRRGEVHLGRARHGVLEDSESEQALVGHALDHQAEVAAHNMLGEKLVYEVTPWFWSDQYDVKLQIAGLNTGYDSTVIRPGKREGSQSIWYYRGEQLLAVDAMNDAPSFMMARRILEAGKSLPKNVAQDAGANLKEWI